MKQGLPQQVREFICCTYDKRTTDTHPMKTTLLQADFIERLSKVSRRMRTAFNAGLAEHGLTLARARVLMCLRREACVTQSALAIELGVEGATVVRLLDGMAKQDLIERRAVDGDRRAKHVVLTPHGAVQAEIVETLAKALRQDVLAGTANADLEAGLRVLDIMARNLRSSSEDDSLA